MIEVGNDGTGVDHDVNEDSHFNSKVFFNHFLKEFYRIL